MVQIVGTWRMKVWEWEMVDGHIEYPVGRDALGYLTYTPDGYLFVAIMRPNRPNYATKDLQGGTDEEKARAASTYWSYCGRYEVKDGRVMHHVELSLFPNWSGTVQERPFEVVGDQLPLAVTRAQPGGTMTSRIIWERADSAGAPPR